MFITIFLNHLKAITETCNFLLQACTSYPYSDSYYGGAVPVYGPQALVCNLLPLVYVLFNMYVVA